jgi:hypothetical protein
MVILKRSILRKEQTSCEREFPARFRPSMLGPYHEGRKLTSALVNYFDDWLK